MNCHIKIGKLSIDRAHHIAIEKSIKNLSDRATITLAREFYLKRNKNIVPTARKNILELIKVGDPVEIHLGYDDDLRLEFKGYVTKISADAPLVIECEDEMYKLRASHFVHSFKKTSLKKLIEHIAPSYKHEIIDDVNLGPFVIDNLSAYEVFEQLKKDYGLFSFFKEDGSLYVGFAFDIKPGKTHRLDLNKNVRALSTEDLEFSRKQDIKLLIRVISKDKRGKKFIEEFGDKGGKEKVFRFSEKQRRDMKKIAEKNYRSLRFDGFKGIVPTWGRPQTRPGEAVTIIDPSYQNTRPPGGRPIASERQGKYLIEGVSITFSPQEGFLRKNTIGRKL